MKRSEFVRCRYLSIVLFFAVPAVAAEESGAPKEPAEAAPAAAVPDAGSQVGTTPAAPAAGATPTPAQLPAAEDMVRLGGRFLTKGVRASWSPDGGRIAFCIAADAGQVQATAGIGVLEIRSGKVTPLTGSGEDPTWSPGDGRWIAYTTGAEEQRELWAVEASGGQPRKLAEGSFPYWASDGKTIYFYARDAQAVMQISVDDDPPKAAKVISVPYRFPTISPDGRRIAYRSGQWLHIVDRDQGQMVKRYVLPGGTGYFGDFSPDGKYLAFGGSSVRDIRGLWVIDLQTGVAMRLTDGPFNLPSWSRDGTKLVFTLNAQAGREVWMIERSQLDSSLVERVALDAYSPPVSDDVAALSSYLQGNAARQAAAQARFARRQQALSEDYREEIGMVAAASREVAQKICELEANHSSDAYLAALETLLPERIQGLAGVGPQEQEALLGDIQHLLNAKAAKGLTGKEATLAISVARALEATGNDQLAVRAYRDFATLFAKSTDPMVARYRSYLDAGAKKLAVLGTPMQLAGTTFQGEPFNWESYRGKIVLVDFWATWCAPCRAELPYVKNCYAAYQDQGFTVVGVSLDKDRDALGKYLAAENVPWVTLHEKEGGGAHPAAKQYEITAIPAMYLVDREGEIVSVSARGAQLVSLLAKMIGPPQQLADKAALAGDWPRASQVLTLAAGLSPHDVQVWTALAVAQLLAGDRAGYESTCQTATARFARSGSGWTKASLVRLCSLASNSTVKDEAVIAAANTHSADVDPATMNLSRGLFEFRLGRFEQAIERLPKAGDDLQVPLSLLYRAMACQHLEREDEAKQLYRQGCEEIGKRVPTAKGDKLADYMPARWIVWGLLEVARREAEAVVSGAAAGSPEKLLHQLASGNVQGAVDALTKMIEQEPNNPGLVTQRADLCVRLGEWQKAARDLDQIVQANPTDSLAWLRVSPVLALAGDKAAYRRFCETMVQRFGNSAQPHEVEKAVKAALLLPGAFNLSELPLAKLEQSLDGSGPSAWSSGWGWATRALAEYRRGNADSALKFAHRVESSSDYATAVNLHPLASLLKALALADLKRDQEARDAYAEGGKLLEARAAELKRTGTWHHDVLIAQIICTEAKARLEKAN